MDLYVLILIVIDNIINIVYEYRKEYESRN